MPTDGQPPHNTPAPQTPPPRTASARPAILLALILVPLVALLRVLAPWDILDNDQLRPLSYILDIIRNNNWLVQHDWTGAVASKPPLYAWIGALPALLTNRVGPLELAIPSTLGVLIGAIAIATAAARAISARAACIAVLAFIATPIMVKQTALARTDALFAGLTTAAALLAFRAWTRSSNRGGWCAFWLVAALATLTKGPLSIVLALAGLAFIRHARPPRDPQAPRRARADLVLALILFLAIVLAWFIAAWLHEGRPFIDKILGRELLGHVVGSSKEHLQQLTFTDRLLEWLVGLFKPTLYLLYHAAPWSIFALLALIRVFREPSSDPARRNFERFCAGWLIVGLAIFSVVPHQRHDLLSPLIAPTAILAAGLIADLTRAWTRRSNRLATASVALAAVLFTLIAYHIAPRGSDTHTRRADIRAVFDQTIVDHAAPPAMITPLDGPYLFTVFANIHTPRLTRDQALRLLARNAPAFVSTRDPEALAAELRAQGNRAFITAQSNEIAVVSNRRELRPTDSVACVIDNLLIETAACRLLPSRRGVLIIEHTADAPGVAAIQNLADHPRTIRWRTTTGESGELTIPPLAERLLTLPATTSSRQ